MAMSRRTETREADLWVSHTQLPDGPAHPFYGKVNDLLREKQFDRFVEAACEPYYADNQGRPSIPPGVYFRILFAGYFEGIGSERGICWRVEDALSLRNFVGLNLTDRCPDHSSLSKIRNRLSEEVMDLVFTWMLRELSDARVLKGKTMGIDATTLEANAAMRSIVRRKGGQDHQTYIRQLAAAECAEEGEDEPDDRESRKRDRKGKKTTSNQDWQSPVDPDAGITRMKNGTTRVAHKVEHGIDMDSGAVVAVTVQAGQTGDCDSLPGTLESSMIHSAAATGRLPEDLVADAGYDSEKTLLQTDKLDLKPYIAQRDQKRNGKGKPDAEKRHKRNLRRNSNSRGKRLQRARGEKVERPFQLLYDRGGLRRLQLRGQSNIRKRLLLQAAAYNLGLLLRKAVGSGTPKAYRVRNGRLLAILLSTRSRPTELFQRTKLRGFFKSPPSANLALEKIQNFCSANVPNPPFSTAC